MTEVLNVEVSFYWSVTVQLKSTRHRLMSVIKAFENEKQNYKANEITHVLFKTFTDITCRNRKLKQHKKTGPKQCNTKRENHILKFLYLIIAH